MAEVTLTDQESLSCSICLDLLNNPVTIPCGHSFCKDCINGLWDQNNDGGVYSCSQCKQTFTQRPSVIECVMLKELAEKLRRTKLQTQTDAEADDVRCDSCTTRRIEAIKSCLTCVSSYCDKHLEQHNELHMGKKHQLIDAADLQSKTCSHHGKLLEYFCCTDQQCICVLCVIDEHKSHDTISAADERAEKQRKLVETHKKFLQKIQEKEKIFKELMKAEESIKHSAQTTITEHERIFKEVVSSIQKTCSHIKELITDKERAGLTHIEGLQEKIQQEIEETRMKVPKLDQLMSTEDHIHFLQNYPSYCEEPSSEDPAELYRISSNPNIFLHNVRMLVSEMQNHLMDVCRKTETKIFEKVLPSTVPAIIGGAADAPETVKLSTTPVFDSEFDSQFTKKEGQWDNGNLGANSQSQVSASVSKYIAEESKRKSEKDDSDRVEEVLYSGHVNLFRFDIGTSQWKEKGDGNIKLLKNITNGRFRVLMKKQHKVDVCADHWITTTMILKPLTGSDRAWMWLANDLSDGDAKLEQLAAKFRTTVQAEEFKQKIEECQRLLLDIPLQTSCKLVNTGRTAHLIQKAEEMISSLEDFKSFLRESEIIPSKDDKRKIQSGDTSENVVKLDPEGSGAIIESVNYDLQEKVLQDGVDTSVTHLKNIFHFGESATGCSFSFHPVLISPSKLNQSQDSVSTDNEQAISQGKEKDFQYFKSIVPLPDLVEVSTGEENEQVVFSHRAKLYRYDKDLSQWKERGVGNLKILQNYESKRVRLVMRRDQVLKLCANHWITSNMKLEPMKGAENAWIWCAFDFAEGEGKVEQLAVRFKLHEIAKSFKEIFEKAKDAQENKALLTTFPSNTLYT